MNLLKDIATAVKLTGEVRKARKEGASGVQVKPVYKVPFFGGPGVGFAGTAESCTLAWYPDLYAAVRDVYDSFDYETKRQLLFTDGSIVDRVKFWQKALRPVLEPKIYHRTMQVIIGWAGRAVRMREEKAVSA